MWKAEWEICEIKVDKDVSYAQARRIYEDLYTLYTLYTRGFKKKGKGNACGFLLIY